MANAIEITELCKVYRRLVPWARREVQAVRNLTLEIPHGKIYGLLGPNGAGKTTVIKMLAGLIVQDSGEISWPVHGRRPSLGAVMEGSRNLYWRLSALENIVYFGEIKGVPRQLIRRQADELLEMFGLADKRDKPAQTLSRGMQQKLAVVLAFLGEPDLLLLDEPTLGLDVASSQSIQRLLKQLCSERQLTILVTTHQMDVAQSLCHQVGIMRDGEVVINEQVSQLVDLFTRQDYIVRLDDALWQRMKSALDSVEYEEVAEQRPGQVSIRFKLASADALYPLMNCFEEHSAMIHDLHQERPSLEDIFVRVTSGNGGEA